MSFLAERTHPYYPNSGCFSFDFPTVREDNLRGPDRKEISAAVPAAAVKVGTG